ncbi:MAG TPA: DoxX family protein [Terriglobales bacterium]|nr:DoxX family protein [Terriglobales bacterium]
MGAVVSAIPALTLLFAGSMKLMQLPSVIQGFAQYGYPAKQIPIIGTIEVCCAVLYLIPPTAVLGAILMTGVWGGAIASNVRVGDAAFVGPLILGVLVWAGLYLRDPRLRALIPLRARFSRQSQ